MMLKSFKNIVFGLVAASISVSAVAQNDRALDLDALLQQLEEGKFAQTQQNKQREQEFMAQRAEQDRILRETAQLRDRTLATSEQLETTFEENEFKLADLNEALTNRLGSLKELFGVLQQVAGDTKNKFYNSVVSAQIPGRAAFLDQLAQDMGSSSKLASIDEIEQVWYEIQREMTQSGKVTKFTTDVVEAGGAKVSKEVVRVGPFALVSDGKYLDYNGLTGTVAELIRQPAGRYGESAAELQASNGELVKFGIDPTGGSILGLLVQAPNLQERVEQGGVVGYIIIVLGSIGILLAVWRMLVLIAEGSRIRKQMASDTPREDNALGRVMAVFQANKDADIETLELHLGEAISAEVPKLTRAIGWIKIISVVAPLLGLLGTVTGMIDVFETMSLFGTGDPKLMAGGISQALVTTVLGLVAAIPCVFLHTLTNNRSRELMMILEERATGILARQSEQQHAKAA
jgi:biopolymer transport protein ExbB